MLQNNFSCVYPARDVETRCPMQIFDVLFLFIYTRPLYKTDGRVNNIIFIIVVQIVTDWTRVYT